MRKIMQQADFSSVVKLDSLLKNKHTYALGPAENLKGEIIILDNQVFTTSVENKKLKNNTNNKAGAALLVYAEVQDWRVINIDQPVHSIKDLEKLLSEYATKNKWEGAFPFQLKTKRGKIDYHVIDWQTGVTHTLTNHKQFALTGQFENEPLILLGFYSTKHQGIITHHSSSVHIHVLQSRTKTVAHVDELNLNSAFELLLPN
jgi:Alpha-acetolactate decarboxylase.